jgi:hypothetical protein
MEFEATGGVMSCGSPPVHVCTCTLGGRWAESRAQLGDRSGQPTIEAPRDSSRPPPWPLNPVRSHQFQAQREARSHSSPATGDKYLQAGNGCMPWIA